MTAIKNEHNRAKTQWVFEPVSVVAGVFLQRLNKILLTLTNEGYTENWNQNITFFFNLKINIDYATKDSSWQLENEHFFR